MLKAWHTHGNTLRRGADFYPLLANLGGHRVSGVGVTPYRPQSCMEWPYAMMTRTRLRDVFQHIVREKY